MSSPDDIKQVIVWNNSLKSVPKGKFAAQIAHGSIAFMTDKIRISQEAEHYSPVYVSPFLSEVEMQWINGIFKKIVLCAHSTEELEEIYNRAKEAGLTTYMIEDKGLTVFKEPTKTCVAIGPDFASKIDPITKDLRLL